MRCSVDEKYIKAKYTFSYLLPVYTWQCNLSVNNGFTGYKDATEPPCPFVPFLYIKRKEGEIFFFFFENEPPVNPISVLL